ncbi:MAG: hypothetical protein WKF40_11165 [Thermoleophilaceae bacterium]
MEGRVNRQIVQLFGISMVLFAVLVGFTSRWSVFEAAALKDEPSNRRPLIEEQQIPRGLVKASDGTVLARSVGRGRGRESRLLAHLPHRAAVLPCRGLLVHLARARRAGALAQRRPDRPGERVRHDLLRAAEP